MITCSHVRVLTLLFSITLFACTGGGEDGTGVIEDNPNPDKGTLIDLTNPPQPILSIGVISDDEGITVNGTRYQIDSSRLLMDGLNTSPEELSKGMVATVLGNISSENQATADKIIVNTALAGPVTHKDLNDQGTGSLDSLGQKILISETTRFDSAITGISNFVDLVIDDFIQVHGFALSNGIIYATYIRLNDASLNGASTFYLTGVIHDLDSTTKTFSIGQLKLDYSGVNQATQLALRNEQLVQVNSATPTTNQSPFLLADQINFIHPIILLKDQRENTRVVMQGIFEYDGSSTNRLNGQVVQRQDQASGGGDSTNDNHPPVSSAPSDTLSTMIPVLTTSEGYFSSDGLFIIEHVH